MSDKITRAAAALQAHWKNGTKLPGLAEPLRPATLADGYLIQAAAAAAHDVVGWKIAATSSQGQQHIGVDGPIAGRLYRTQVHNSGVEISMRGNQMAAAECEFVFRLARDIPARATAYSREEVMDAVASLHPGMEIPDSRFEDFARVGAPSLAADNAAAHLMLIGAPTHVDWRTVDLASHATSLRINGQVVTQGTGADVLGDPRDALLWLANSQQMTGASLQAGHFVTTGVTGTPFDIEAGLYVEADLGVFGMVSARLVA